MDEEIKDKGPENIETGGGQEEGRGVLSPKGRAIAGALVAVLVLAVAYALATGKDIPAVVGSIVSVLMHAVLGA